MEKLIKTLYIIYLLYCIFYFIITDTTKTELQAINVFNFLIGGISLLVFTLGYIGALVYIYIKRKK